MHSRYEIGCEQYILTVAVEANLTLEIGTTTILPAAIRYQTELAAERRRAQGGRRRRRHLDPGGGQRTRSPTSRPGSGTLADAIATSTRRTRSRRRPTCATRCIPAMADGPRRGRHARGPGGRRPVAAADLPGDALHPLIARATAPVDYVSAGAVEPVLGRVTTTVAPPPGVASIRMVPPCDPATGGQAHTGAHHRPLDPHERLEDPLPVGLVDPDAVVDDPQDPRAVHVAGIDLHIRSPARAAYSTALVRRLWTTRRSWTGSASANAAGSWLLRSSSVMVLVSWRVRRSSSRRAVRGLSCAHSAGGASLDAVTSVTFRPDPRTLSPRPPEVSW